MNSLRNGPGITFAILKGKGTTASLWDSEMELVVLCVLWYVLFLRYRHVFKYPLYDGLVYADVDALVSRGLHIV